MEALGLAANIIAVVDLAAKVASICSAYYSGVKDAEDDIRRVRNEVERLAKTLRHVRRLLDGRNAAKLEASQDIRDAVQDCQRELDRLVEILEPQKKRRKVMSRFGMRALKWPLQSKEVDRITADLSRARDAIDFALQIDSTTILLGIDQKIMDMSLLTRVLPSLPAQAAPSRPSDIKNEPVKPCSTVPFGIDPDFVDRPTILGWMKEKYEGPPSRFALVGLGGVGKSQLAIHFCHKMRELSPDTWVFWVHAGTKARFQEGYRRIAQKLQLPDKDALKQVQEWLQFGDAGRWLLVLDNVDDINVLRSTSRPQGAEDDPPSGGAGGTTDVNQKTEGRDYGEAISAYLPTCGNGKILITSRSMAVAEQLTGGSHRNIMRTTEMDQDQALELFRSRLTESIHDDDEVILELLQTLEFLPLAITQAASYINRRAPRLTVRGYLDEFRRSEKRSSNLLLQDAGDVRRDQSASNSVVTTWQMTFEQICKERKSASDLLSLMCFFNPQDIPEAVLLEVYRLAYKAGDSDTESDGSERSSQEDDKEGEAEESRAELEHDLDVLRGYSLISLSPLGATCNLHPLVHLCTRAWLALRGESQKWSSAFLNIATGIFTGIFVFKSETGNSIALKKSLYPHLEQHLSSIPTDPDNFETWLILVAYAGIYVPALELTAELAESYHRKAIEAGSERLGADHDYVILLERNLSHFLRMQDKLDEALETLRDIDKRYRTADHDPNFEISVLTDYVMIYSEQDRFEDAENLLLEALNKAKRISGVEGKDLVCTILGHLGYILIKSGNLGRGASTLVKCLALCENATPYFSGMVSWSCSLGLANVLSDLGRDREAYKYQRKALRHGLLIWGPDNLITAEMKVDLVRYRFRAGKATEEDLRRVRACRVRRLARSLGPNHEDTRLAKSKYENLYEEAVPEDNESISGDDIDLDSSSDSGSDFEWSDDGLGLDEDQDDGHGPNSDSQRGLGTDGSDSGDTEEIRIGRGEDKRVDNRSRHFDMAPREGNAGGSRHRDRSTNSEREERAFTKQGQHIGTMGRALSI